MWWWVSSGVLELFVPRIWRICRFWPQARILWGRGCFAACLHGCLNVCSPDCFVNTILAVLARRQNNALFLLESVALLHRYTHSTFFGAARHSEIPTYYRVITSTLINTCNPPSILFALSHMIVQCLIRLEARFLACLFSFQPKAWVWKVSPGKDGDAEALCDGKSPYLANGMQTLAAVFFYANLSGWKMVKFAARFCINKTAEKNCGTDFLTHESISVLRDVLRPECWDAQAGDASS